jgi:hypothetical protein
MFIQTMERSVDTCVAADLRYIASRGRKEGISFYTKTLPSLGRSVDKALSQDVPPVIEPNLRWDDSSPTIFRWLWFRVFHTSAEGANLRSDANPKDVLRLRQLTYAFYKLETTFTAKQLERAIASYRETEQDLEGT